MSQVFAAQIIPAEAWLLLGTETARVLMLGAETVLNYNSGSPDTLPALTAGVVDGSVPLDTTADNWVGYTVQGSNTLSVAKESALPGAGTFALLCYVTVHGVFLYQQPGGSGGGGSSAFTFVPKTADYTILTSDSGIAVDATSNAVTITVPTAIGATQEYTIKRVDTAYAYAVIIAPAVFGQTLEFISALSLAVQGHSVVLGSDGANWLVASSHYPDPATHQGALVAIDVNGVPQELLVGTEDQQLTVNTTDPLLIDWE